MKLESREEHNPSGLAGPSMSITHASETDRKREMPSPQTHLALEVSYQTEHSD